MSITTLDKFRLGGLYRITEIKFWLLEMKSYYERVKKIDYVLYLYEINGEVIRLPPICLEPTQDEIFLDLYESLESLNILNSREKYFQLEVKEFRNIKENPELIKKWLNKNEIIGTEEFVCFLIDYLDYSEEAYHLQINNPINAYKGIFIERKSFKHTIEFLEIFNENYYDGKK